MPRQKLLKKTEPPKQPELVDNFISFSEPRPTASQSNRLANVFGVLSFEKVNLNPILLLCTRNGGARLIRVVKRGISDTFRFGVAYARFPAGQVLGEVAL